MGHQNQSNHQLKQAIVSSSLPKNALYYQEHPLHFGQQLQDTTITTQNKIWWSNGSHEAAAAFYGAITM